LFRLVLRPDNTFEISVDHTLVNHGSLLDSFEPPVNPPAEIDDPHDKMPAGQYGIYLANSRIFFLRERLLFGLTTIFVLLNVSSHLFFLFCLLHPHLRTSRTSLEYLYFKKPVFPLLN
jgi:hypothetical protein